MPARKINIILFLLASVVLNCFGKTVVAENILASSTTPVKKITKIQGSIAHASQSHVSLSFYKDFISLDQASFQIPIDSENKFAMDFLLAEPTICILTYRNEEIQLFLEPGNELQLNFDDIRPAQSMKFKGQAAENNKFLHYFHQKFKYWNNNYISYEMLSRSATSFRRFMNALYNSKWNFYQNYKRINGAPFTKAFHHYMYAEIDYWRAYYLLLYPIEHGLTNEQTTALELPDNYFDFLKNTLISNDEALNNRNYLFFLDQYMKLLADRPKELKSEQLQSTEIVVDISSMLVLKSPDNPPIMEELAQGTRLLYLQEKSKFQSQTLVEDVVQKAYWYKVKTPSGEIGWILGVGVHFESVEEEQLVNGPTEDLVFTNSLTFRNAQKYLRAKARYYTQANDLYWRSHIESSPELTKDLEDFVSTNEYIDFSQIIYEAYNSKLPQLKESFVAQLDSLNSYSIVEQPRFLTRQKVEKVYLSPLSPKSTESLAQLLANLSGTDQEKVISTVLGFAARLDQYKKDRPDVDPATAIASVSDNILVEGQGASSVTEDESTKNPTDYIDLGPGPKRKHTLSYLNGETENGLGVVVKLVLYSDPIQFNENVYELIFSSSDKDKKGKALELKDATIGFIEYGNEKLEIYLEPGDELMLRFHPDNFLKSLKFTGKGSQHNNYLLQQKRLGVDLDKQLKANMKGMNHEDFKAFMQETRAEKLKFYQSFVTDNGISEGFANFAKADIDYWYAYQLMNYPWEHPLYNDQDAPLELPTEYYQFVEEIPTAATGALPNKFYTYYLSQLFDHLLAKSGNEGLNELELVEKYLSGESLFYYRAKILSMACKRGSAKESGPAISTFIEECPYELYNEILREIYLEAKGLSLGDEAPVFSLKDIDGKPVELQDFKGKVVYLDFWASWCSPCVMQIRNSRQWKKKFKDKDVVFVYISLDKDKNAWRNFLRNERLDGVHLIVPEASAYKAPIARKYNVKRLPAYFLIDKEGKISYTPDSNQRKMRLEDRILELISAK